MSQRCASLRESYPLFRCRLYSLRGEFTMLREILLRRLPW
jgi:hypothetical protein